jgi:hypothetical protein
MANEEMADAEGLNFHINVFFLQFFRTFKSNAFAIRHSPSLHSPSLHSLFTHPPFAIFPSL